MGGRLLHALFLSLLFSVFSLSIPLASPANLEPANLTLTQFIARGLSNLHQDPRPHYSTAKLRIIALQRQNGYPPHRENTTDTLHHIYLGLSVEPPPPRADLPNFMMYMNYMDGDWQKWRDHPYIYRNDRAIPQEISWTEVEGKMPLERADQLMKENGLTGAYLSVILQAFGGERLAWQFRGYDYGTRQNGVVTVDVLTGDVRLLQAAATA